MEELILKKVRFMEIDETLKEATLPESSINPKISWKEKLIGSPSLITEDVEEDDDIEVLDGEIQTSTINGPYLLIF